MRYSIKSDKAKARASKARARIAQNQVYINAMNKKMNEVSQEQIKEVAQYLKQQ